MSVISVVAGGLCSCLVGQIRRLPSRRCRRRWGVLRPPTYLILRQKRESAAEFLQGNAFFLAAAAKGDSAGSGGGGGGAEGSLTTTVEDTRIWWHHALHTAASLYPLYVTVGGLVACINPSAFSFFVERGPASYRLALAFIMLAMGLTIKLRDLLDVLMRRPLSFTIMPALGVIISKLVGLPPPLSVGLILLSCCPGGTASNVVTFVAQGDVPLSVVMTVCTTLGAVICTPLLTKILAGAYVPVDAAALSTSTLQVVVIPVLLGSYMQSTFPAIVKAIVPFAPLLAVLASSLLASSVFSENVVHLNASMPSSFNQFWGLESILTSEPGLLILSVLLLHLGGFLVGYVVASICGFRERQRRAISIEVGMQNSSLGVVLATSHFSSNVVLPPALSAVIMNIMGSTLGLIWRYIRPDDGGEESLMNQNK
ncbi:putative sodium/metabolite cotransporter [Nymphaea thermarum]|nr:putative sodium/metabolite cotransporter [Nymphaea thermarum]